MSVHRNKKLLVCASFVALVVVAACVLSERDNDPAARTKNESLSSHAICRKTPAVSHCKLTSSIGAHCRAADFFRGQKG